MPFEIFWFKMYCFKGLPHLLKTLVFRRVLSYLASHCRSLVLAALSLSLLRTSPYFRLSFLGLRFAAISGGELSGIGFGSMLVFFFMTAKGTLISEPRCSTPCEMRFFPREKGKWPSFEGFSPKRSFSFLAWEKSHLAGGRKSRLAN